MSPSRYAGGCHCGALRWQLASATPLPALTPRACDCDFCTRHRAEWVSDPDGRLRIEVDGARLQRFRQGAGQADFLLCRDCGVLVAVIARTDDGRQRGAVNRQAFDERDALGMAVPVSPKQLSADDKRSRWAQIWTPVELVQRD